jgi:radical SAM protein with 4Fe4S-binding SPASM domain
MRYPGAFERTLRATRFLRDANVGVALKATIMTENWQELPGMARIARDMGAEFSANISVTPRIDRDASPLKLALTRRELEEVDQGLIDGGLIPGEEGRGGGAVLKCPAGGTSAGISPQGDLFPCISFRHRLGNVRERTVKEMWHDAPDPFLVELRQVQPEDVAECFSCEHRALCRRCPGVAYLETGRLRSPSPSSCRIAGELAWVTERTRSVGG